jgi:serine phosphatase RsbU (regulator of sigma subunit)
MAMTGMPLDRLAAEMNDLHYAEGPEARLRYVTCIVLRLDPAAHSVECVNAGHNPGFLLNGAGDHVPVEASGPPLGMFPARRYSVQRLRMTPGDRLLLYTDGLIEVFQGDEEFGEQGLRESFRNCPEQTAGATLDRLWNQLRDFAQGCAQSDDMTALALFRCAENLNEVKVNEERVDQ